MELFHSTTVGIRGDIVMTSKLQKVGGGKTVHNYCCSVKGGEYFLTKKKYLKKNKACYFQQNKNSFKQNNIVIFEINQ